jgi:Na+/H+ antiporter NhaD/arsenite permease-like protein
VALAIFLLTYLFLAGGNLPGLKLDRPGGALLGATAMVALGVVAPSEVKEAIDADTLILLLGMMLLGAYLTGAGFFRTSAWLVLHLAKTPRMLLVALSAVSAILSALLVNDTVCLILTPLVLAVTESGKVRPLPYLLALCMASNAGSVATFTGNPQNMLIGTSSGISFASFAAYMVLPALAATAATVGVLLFAFRRELPAVSIAPSTPRPEFDRAQAAVCLLALLAVLVAFLLGYSMAWSALAGAGVVMVLSRKPPRDTLMSLDFVLLLFFASLFIVVHGVNKAGWVERMHDALDPSDPWRFSALTVVASNLFSNVPYVMVARHWVPKLPDPTFYWHLLALGSTLAGNLTLVGSIANLIVFEGAREKITVTFWQYFRVGAPATLASLAAAMGVLVLEHRLFP